MTRKIALMGAVLLVASACGRGDASSGSARRVTSTPVPSASSEAPAGASAGPSASPGASNSKARVTTPKRPPTPGTTTLDDAKVKLTKIADIPKALAMDAPAGGDLYVATKSGQIRAIRNGTVDPVAVLDISSEVSTGGEQGLLGLAISPDLGYLYVDFTDTSGDTRIREYRLSGGRAETSSLREVLKVAQPYANHNGGDLHFGPDRYLYITLGDGGSAGDPSDNGQSLDTLLGKILRINPRPSGSAPYSVPSDNPFVSRSGAKPEIWAYGLRNPWRLSFDKSTNDMYIGDVGQDAWEEIDYQASNSRGGLNYGWKRREGTHTYQGSPASNETLPIYEYSHADGNCSITGGYVYRGQAIPALQGAYLFADYCAGRLRAFVPRNGQAINHRFLGPEVGSVTAFGQDLNGELYVLSGDSGVYRIDPA